MDGWSEINFPQKCNKLQMQIADTHLSKHCCSYRVARNLVGTRTSHSAPVMSVIPALITLFAEWRLSAHCTGGH